MDKRLLKSYMARFGDTGETLAEALGMRRNTLSSKMNEYRGAEFTQTEMKIIKERYSLTAEDIDKIFFGLKVS